MNIQKLFVQNCLCNHSAYKEEVLVGLLVNIRHGRRSECVAVLCRYEKCIVWIEDFKTQLLIPFSCQPACIESLFVDESDLEILSHFLLSFAYDLVVAVMEQIFSSYLNRYCVALIFQSEYLGIEKCPFHRKVNKVVKEF